MREPSNADMSFERFVWMLRTNYGLELLRAGMPPGSTLEDARALHRKLKQVGSTKRESPTA